jgi:hypothetical protein
MKGSITIMAYDHQAVVRNSQSIAVGHASPQPVAATPADAYAQALTILRTLDDAKAVISDPALAAGLDDALAMITDMHGIPPHVAANPPAVAPKAAPVPVDNNRR